MASRASHRDSPHFGSEQGSNKANTARLFFFFFAGPSAGVTMATSLLSLALDHKVDATIAMTGELTVTGKVLRIGGLREKAVAARRSGAKTIIFPADNMSDWLELPEVRRVLSSRGIRSIRWSLIC